MRMDTGTAPGAGASKHWDATSGTAANPGSGAETAVVLRGSSQRAWRFSTNGTARATLDKTLATPTAIVARCYVRFGSLPNLDVGIIGAMNGATEYSVFYDTSAGGLAVRHGTTQAGAFPVVVDTWYRIDLKFDVSANPHTLDWQVDGAAQTQLTRAVAAASFTPFRIGCGLSGTVLVNATVYVDDVMLSITGADYPLGAGTCVGLQPIADGTHSFSAATDFEYNDSTGIPTTATDTWSYVDDTLTGTTDFIAAVGNAGGEYLEWTYRQLPGDVNTVNGLEVVSAHNAQGTNANTQSLRVLDGATLHNVFSDVDFSISGTNTTVTSKSYSTAPSSGVAWTAAKVNALKTRWTSSFTTPDVTPAPYIQGIRLECDYVVSNAVPWQLTKGQACYTVDHLIRFGTTVNPPPPTANASNAFVTRFGVRGGNSEHVHRFLRGETEDR
jgi:hypothetical protein